MRSSETSTVDDHGAAALRRSIVLRDMSPVLGRKDDGIDPRRLSIPVLDRDLALAVWSQPRSSPFLRTYAIFLASRCASEIGNGISSGVSLTGEPDHHPLVAGPHPVDFIVTRKAIAGLERGVDTIRDFGTLRLDR